MHTLPASGCHHPAVVLSLLVGEASTTLHRLFERPQAQKIVVLGGTACRHPSTTLHRNKTYRLNSASTHFGVYCPRQCSQRYSYPMHSLTVEQALSASIRRRPTAHDRLLLRARRIQQNLVPRVYSMQVSLARETRADHVVEIPTRIPVQPDRRHAETALEAARVQVNFCPAALPQYGIRFLSGTVQIGTAALAPPDGCSRHLPDENTRLRVADPVSPVLFRAAHVV